MTKSVRIHRHILLLYNIYQKEKRLAGKLLHIRLINDINSRVNTTKRM